MRREASFFVQDLVTRPVLAKQVAVRSCCRASLRIELARIAMRSRSSDTYRDRTEEYRRKKLRGGTYSKAQTRFFETLNEQANGGARGRLPNYPLLAKTPLICTF